jgi:peptidoglycan hydrolase-like protein with peptidoglycan-binding domain
MPTDSPKLRRRLVGAVTGADVERLQKALREIGLRPGPIDGIYGYHTAGAVREFQRREGLPVDGVVGPATWRRLSQLAGKLLDGAAPSKLLHGATSGEDVKWLQRALLEAGCDPGQIDGVYGPETAAAVIALQQKEGLTPDGIVGQSTWDRLATRLRAEALAAKAGTDPPPEAPADQPSGPAVATIAGFSPDRVSEVDHLGREEMALILCRVLAARSLEPPLAVGLFGNWGSGKSTFMRQMQRHIATLSDASEHARRAGEPTAFCSHVRQVDFNAWLHSDSDLWPSLAAQVFRSVAGIQADAFMTEDENERLRRYQQQADPEYRALIAGREAAAAEEAAARQELEVVNRRIPELRREVVDRASTLGPEASTAVERGESLRQALPLPSRLVRGWISLTTATKVVLFAAVTVAITAFVASIADPTWFPGSASWASWTFTALAASGPVVTFAVKALSFVDDTIRIDEQIRAMEQQQIHASERLQAAVARRKEKADEVAAFVPGPLLGAYAHEQADRWARRETLGAVAEIRRDFARLSQMIVQSRAEGWGDSEQTTEPAPLDRVIVYIDDLDRCHADLVVEVLEAIKLLMDLPHFVVVVGVDPRWLLRSLEVQFARELGLAGTQASAFDGSHGAVTPQHYLEKIFQFSVTLPPMTAAGYARIIRSLFPQVSAPWATASSGGSPGTLRRSAPETVPNASAAPEESPQVGSPGRQSPRQATPAEKPAGTGEPVVELIPSDLEITEAEMAFMERLAPLIDTPRLAKRLANTYRLLRATYGEQQVLERQSYEAILLLIGVMVGFPRQTPDLIRSLRAANPSTTWPEFIAGADGTPDRLAAILQSLDVEELISMFQVWVDAVAAFSFQLSQPS